MLAKSSVGFVRVVGFFCFEAWAGNKPQDFFFFFAPKGETKHKKWMFGLMQLLNLIPPAATLKHHVQWLLFLAFWESLLHAYIYTYIQFNSSTDCYLGAKADFNIGEGTLTIWWRVKYLLLGRKVVGGTLLTSPAQSRLCGFELPEAAQITIRLPLSCT